MTDAAEITRREELAVQARAHLVDLLRHDTFLRLPPFIRETITLAAQKIAVAVDKPLPEARVQRISYYDLYEVVHEFFCTANEEEIPRGRCEVCGASVERVESSINGKPVLPLP